MNITVTAKPGETMGTLKCGDLTFPCALGRSGIIAQTQKQEGDGATPAGRWPMRRLLFRADRLPSPETQLPCVPIRKRDGWCDDASDPAYNRPVSLPYGASAETLWRNDILYDLVIILGHNDDPVVAAKGSAIFFHLAVEREAELAPTEGCIALQRDAMRQVLEVCSTETVMEVRCL